MFKQAFFMAIILSLMSAIGCKKEGSSPGNGNPAVSYWSVKYEVNSTNPKTRLQVILNDETGNQRMFGTLMDSTTYQPVPFSYSAQFSKDPGLSFARGLSAIVVDASNFNIDKDVITMKIFVDGKLVNQSTSKTGVLFIASVAYLLN
jgi:hypothetical protein